MIKLTVTEFARSLRTVFDRIEYHNEEVVISRNKHDIARIIPGPPLQRAREAMSDLYRTLPARAGESWVHESRIPSSLEDEMRDPWDS